jgi:iron complex transport system substrate-binding protein
LVAGAFVCGAIAAWMAPVSGVAKLLREDRGGPDELQLGPLSFPREWKDLDGVTVRIPAPPRRVISQYWSLDDYVYSVLPPERIVGVSESAYQEHFSNVFHLVERHRPVVATDPETVLRQNPDLLLVSGGARGDFTALIRSTGIPIVRMATLFRSLDQVAATTRLVGYLTGEDEAAEREVARLLTQVEEARALKLPGTPAPLILGYAGRYGYGTDTLFDDIIRTLGGINAAAEGGLRGYSAVSSEQIVRWDPEWIVVPSNPGQEDEVRARLLADPAIALTRAARNRRILVYEHRIFMPMSPFTRHLISALARDVYGS